MQKSTEKYLFSGASGTLGTAIRRECIRREIETLKLVRPARPANTPTRPAAHDRPAFRNVAVALSGEVAWNPSASPAVAHPELLEGITAAIHLGGSNLAAHRWTPDYKREIASSRIDSTRAIATTLAALKKPPATLLVASGVGIYGDRGDEILDDSSTPGSGFLADVCRQWEAASEPAVQAGIRVVHMRFGVVISDRSNPGAFAPVFRIFSLGLGGRLGSGNQWMSWVSLEDMVSAAFFVLQNPSLSGALNITAPNPVTNAQFTQALAGRLHRPAILPVPAAALRLVMGEMADEALLASNRAIPSGLTAAGFQFANPTIDLALAAALPKR